jgi:hypothetical protein
MNAQWTNDPPVQPGPHFWRPNPKAQTVLYWLTVLDGKLMAFIPTWIDLSDPVACKNQIEDEYVPANQLGGEWCRLVSACELEAAHKEGTAGINWESSRANRITNGLPT